MAAYTKQRATYTTRMNEGHHIKVTNDDARAYIAENAEGLKVKIVARDNGEIYKEE